MKYKIKANNKELMEDVFKDIKNLYEESCKCLQEETIIKSASFDRQFHIIANLQSKNLSAALISYILEGNTELFKKHMHLAAQMGLWALQVNYKAYGIMDGENLSGYINGHYPLQYAVLSDDYELAKKCAEMMFDLEEPSVRYSYMGDFWCSYAIKYLVLSEEDNLKFAATKACELLNKKTYPAYDKIWIEALMAIINHDGVKLVEKLEGLAKGFKRLGYAVPEEEKKICLDAVMFAKLARRHGIKIDVNTLEIPGQLVSDNPLEYYPDIIEVEKPDLLDSKEFNDDFITYMEAQEKKAKVDIEQHLAILSKGKIYDKNQYCFSCSVLWDAYRICATSEWMLKRDSDGFRKNIHDAAQVFLPAIKYNKRTGEFQGLLPEKYQFRISRPISQTTIKTAVYFAILSDEESLLKEVAKSAHIGPAGWYISSATDVLDGFVLDIVKAFVQGTPEKADHAIKYLKKRFERGMCTPHNALVVSILIAIYENDSNKCEELLKLLPNAYQRTIFDEYYEIRPLYEDTKLCIEGLALAKLALLTGLDIIINTEQLPKELMCIKKQKQSNVFYDFPKQKLVIGD